MKKSLITTALVAVLLFTSLFAEAAMKKHVTFESENQMLVGELFLPDDYDEGQQLPGVVVTGAWTTVKEQMPATYAAELADRGYAALVFDFRGWGQSEGSIKYLEDPTRKTADIDAAVNYLVTRSEVQHDSVAGLGICTSTGYMSDVAANNPNMKTLALVAPWLHNAEIVAAVYGGQDGINSLISAAQTASKAEKPVYLEAASLTNESAVMFQAPYYTESDRGLIPEYDNKFNAASWKGWLAYDAIKTAKVIDKPVLLVHSEAAAIPQGAKEYARMAGDNAELLMLEDVTQFDFYDQPEVVAISVDKVTAHFENTLNQRNK